MLQRVSEIAAEGKMVALIGGEFGFRRERATRAEVIKRLDVCIESGGPNFSV
jgi:hypothetical protein